MAAYPSFARHFLTACILLLCLAPPVLSQEQKNILIFAAASQQNAIEAVITAYAKTETGPVKASYQSSSALARQIEQGAPADIFISAHPQWMDYLQARGMINAATRTDIIGNSLVLITAAGLEMEEIILARATDLGTQLGGRRLAIGDPDHVPAGIYAKQALQNLGLWKGVEKRLARTGNVRAALALVSRGETPLGIVYRSDAAADRTVRITGTFPEASHDPVIYPAAVTASSRHPQAAQKFLTFLQSETATRIFRRYGFEALR